VHKLDHNLVVSLELLDALPKFVDAQMDRNIGRHDLSQAAFLHAPGTMPFSQTRNNQLDEHNQDLFD
jgi:hypothetical protein